MQGVHASMQPLGCVVRTAITTHTTVAIGAQVALLFIRWDEASLPRIKGSAYTRTMVSIEFLIDELNGIEDFVMSQISVGASEKELRQGQAGCIKLKIQMLRRIDMAGATKLTNAIKRASWDASEHTMLGKL